MAKIKVGFDAKELDEAEYTEGEGFEEYEGEVPPRGTVLDGRIKRMWFKVSSNDNEMLTVIWEAEGNKGDLEQYNGLGVWDNIVFTPKAAFRYKPFLNLFKVTIKDVKTKMDGDEEDNVGVPVNKIGPWNIDSERSHCAVKLTRRKNRDSGEIEARIQQYMPAGGSGSKKAASNGAAEGGKKKKGKNKGGDPF